MENSNPTPESHHRKGHHADMAADMDSARLAYEAWKSDDPKQWDHALDERERLSRKDPKAWHLAMKEIDVEEEAARQAKIAEQQREMQARLQAIKPLPVADGSPAGVAPPATDGAGAQLVPAGADVAAVVPAPPGGPQEMPENGGYAPDSPYAPPPPNSPGYIAAYGHRKPKFYGINLGIVKLGVTNEGSIDAGVNIGLARGEVKVGLENRAEGELFPVGGPIHARVGAGVGVNADGFHAEAGAGGNFFNIVGGDVDADGRLGRDIGVDGDARGKVLFAEGEGAGGASLSDQGIKGYVGGNADVGKVIGGRAGGRAAVGPHSGVAGGAGLEVAGNTLDFGPSVDVYPDGTVTGGVHLDPSKDNVPTYYPTGNRAVDAPP